jgi:hypothetical protein
LLDGIGGHWWTPFLYNDFNGLARIGGHLGAGLVDILEGLMDRETPAAARRFLKMPF